MTRYTSFRGQIAVGRGGDDRSLIRQQDGIVGLQQSVFGIIYLVLVLRISGDSGS